MSSTEEYWLRDVSPGEFALWAFSGQDGLDRLSGPSRMTAESDGAFEARMGRVQLDHVALESFSATPHRVVRRENEIENDPGETLVFVFLQKGAMHVEVGDTAFTLRAGEFVIFDGRDPIAYAADCDTRTLRAVIGIEHVPPQLRRRGMTIPGPLELTPLVDSFVAFATTVLRSASQGAPLNDFIIRALADLQSSVLAEAQSTIEESAGAAGLRYRIEEYINQHLTDPDLAPPTVASALGISLRHAHGVFNDQDHTIARYIRDRRIAAVALELRTASRNIPLDELAARYGFSNAETMGRAFRSRFGASPSVYRAEGHRNLG